MTGPFTSYLPDLTDRELRFLATWLQDSQHLYPTFTAWLHPFCVAESERRRLGADLPTETIGTLPIEFSNAEVAEALEASTSMSFFEHVGPELSVFLDALILATVTASAGRLKVRL